MQTIMYVELNAFALAVLLLIYLNVAHRSEKYLMEQKLFLGLLASNALILVLDTATWLLDGKLDPKARGLYIAVTVLYYAANPVTSMMWAFYANFNIFRDENRIKKMFFPMMLPVLANAVVAVSSIFGNYLFYIDAKNVYHRGPFFFFMALLCYIYMLSPLIHIVMRHDRIEKPYFLPILTFAFLPFLGGILQYFFYGISLIWVCMTLSILMIFINIQNDQLNKDHLTGLFNRRQLDHYLHHRLFNTKNKGLLAGIMIDLNAFKKINDLYGHRVGDEALENTAALLKRTFRQSDFIARYGGDEFFILMELENPSDLTQSIERLRENAAEFNTQNTAPYTLELSIGYDYYNCNTHQSAYDFIHHIDHLMYADKPSIQKQSTPDRATESVWTDAETI